MAGCSVCGTVEVPTLHADLMAHFRVGDARVLGVVRAAFGAAFAVAEMDVITLCREHGAALEVALTQEYRRASLYVKPTWPGHETGAQAKPGDRRTVDLTTWPGDVVGKGCLGVEYLLFGRVPVRTVWAEVGGVKLRGVWSVDGGDVVNLREVA